MKQFIPNVYMIMLRAGKKITITTVVIYERIDPTILNYVTLDNKLVPIFFKYDDKGNKITTTGKEGGPAVVDEDYSRPYTRDQALVSMGYRGATKKQLREDQQKLQSPSKNKTPGVDVENLRKKYNY